MTPIYWRFFTEIRATDTGVACCWTWQRSQEGRVLSSRSGFATLRDTVRSAHENGFSGDIDADYAGVPLRERENGEFSIA